MTITSSILVLLTLSGVQRKLVFCLASESGLSTLVQRLLTWCLLTPSPTNAATPSQLEVPSSATAAAKRSSCIAKGERKRIEDGRKERDVSRESCIVSCEFANSTVSGKW
jgi:hypothetical protein